MAWRQLHRASGHAFRHAYLSLPPRRPCPLIVPCPSQTGSFGAFGLDASQLDVGDRVQFIDVQVEGAPVWHLALQAVLQACEGDCDHVGPIATCTERCIESDA